MGIWVVVAVVVLVGIVFAAFGLDRYRGAGSRALEGRRPLRGRRAVDGMRPAGGGHAQPTAEVFVDPETKQRMRVWYDPDSGRREYRAEEAPDASAMPAPGDLQPDDMPPPVAALNRGREDARTDTRTTRVGGGGAGAGAAMGGGGGIAAAETRTIKVGEGNAGAGTAIKVTGLTKRFGENVAVERLSFDVEPGRIVGFLGPNGAGKTTTMRALLGLARPTAGSAMIAGRCYAELEQPAQTVGALLDGDDLHPGRSGRNHLRVLARAAGTPPERVAEVLDLVGLTDVADRRAGSYSLGMRQRLGLAAALLGDPDVLVLDEPANGLDPQGIRWLRNFLRSQASSGRTILVSSHVLAEISQIADEVVVINHGRSLLQAPLAELIAQRNGGMRVAGPDVERLAELLRADGARVESATDNAIVVADRTGEQIGRMIAQHGIVISELTTGGESLEDVFFELTGSTGGPS